MIHIPLPLDLSGSNVTDAWRFFRASYENYEIASGLDTRELRQRIANLLTVIGSEGFKLYRTLPLAANDRISITNILNVIERHIIPTTNIIYDTFLFNAAKQESEKSIERFIQRLRQLSSTCEFREMENELITDRIVYSIRDDSIRKRLLTTPDLTLHQTINICQVAEQTDIQMSMMHADRMDEQVNSIRKIKCSYCGSSHEKLNKSNSKKCPAYGQICKNCEKSIHFAKVCRSREDKSNR